MEAESLLISPRLKSRARGLYGFGLSGRERVQLLELLLEWNWAIFVAPTILFFAFYL